MPDDCGQSGMLNPNWFVNVAESRKKKPFEPLSMKLDPWPLPDPLKSLYNVPMNWAAKLPVLGSTGNTAALPKPLLDCVPMPNVRVPVALVCPVSGTAGKLIMTPLLSVVNIHTGFCSCAVRLCDVGVQF